MSRASTRFGRRNRETRVLFIVPCMMILIGAAHSGTADDRSGVENVGTLKEPSGSGRRAEDLRTEIDQLWDFSELHQRSLNEEIISETSSDGWKTIGVYFDGYVGSSGPDRVFCYFAWPEGVRERMPLFLDLTGGSPDEKRAWYLAKSLGCAAMVIEWRMPDAARRSKWTISMGAGSMYEMATLRDAIPYRLTAAFSRAIDLAVARSFIDPQEIHCGGGSMGGPHG